MSSRTGRCRRRRRRRRRARPRRPRRPRPRTTAGAPAARTTGTTSLRRTTSRRPRRCRSAPRPHQPSAQNTHRELSIGSRRSTFVRRTDEELSICICIVCRNPAAPSEQQVETKPAPSKGMKLGAKSGVIAKAVPISGKAGGWGDDDMDDLFGESRATALRRRTSDVISQCRAGCLRSSSYRQNCLYIHQP